MAGLMQSITGTHNIAIIKKKIPTTYYWSPFPHKETKPGLAEFKGISIIIVIIEGGDLFSMSVYSQF
jgi:hypothetical protein